MSEEARDDLQVQLEDTQEQAEDNLVAIEDQPETDSGGDDELDRYTRGVSKRINKLNEKIRMAEERAASAESRYSQLQSEYNQVKTRASVLDKSYTEEYENRVKSQRQQAEDLYRKARETNDPELEVKSVELLNKVALEEERVRLAKVQLEQQQQSAKFQPESNERIVQNTQQQVYDTPKPDEKAVAWAEQNPWFQKDRVKTYTAMGIHEDLTSEGYDGTEDEYYEELNKRLKRVYPDLEQTQGEKKEANSSVQRVASASSGSRQQAQGKRSGLKINSSHLSVKSNLKPYGMTQEEWLKRVGKEMIKLEGAK